MRVATVLSGHSIIQGLQLLTGVLIINHLSIDQYAVYTVAGTLIAVGSLVTNSGVLYALAVFVARSETKEQRAAYVAEAIYLRQKLILLTIPIIAIIAVFLHAVFGSWRALLMYIIVVLVSVYVTSIVEMRRAILLAEQNVKKAILVDLIAGCSRTVFIVPYLIVGGSSVLVILVLTLGSTLIAYRLLPKPEASEGNKLLRQQYAHFVRPLLPEYVYVLLQGHVVNFVLGLSGASRQIGELGALGRLGQIVGTVAVLNQTLVQPYISRFSSGTDFRRRGVIVIMLALGGALLIVGVGFIIPNWLVWILGAKYQHLVGLVPWMMAIVGLQQFSGTLYTICVASGRPFGLVFTVPVGLVVQLTYLLFVGVKDLNTAIAFALAGTVSDLVIRLTTLLHLFRGAQSTKNEGSSAQ